MTRAPALMSSLPPDLHDAVMQAAETQTYGEIQEWLNAAGIPANYNQVLRFVTDHGGSRATEWAIPAAGHRERMQQYVGAVMAHDSELFTIRNLGLRGPIWSMCSRALMEAGLIKATRRYSPVLFRRLVPASERTLVLVDDRRHDDAGVDPEAVVEVPRLGTGGKDMIYHFKKAIEYFLDMCLQKSISFQDYINARYIGTDDVFIVDKKYLKDCTYNVNGKRFHITNKMEAIDTINEDYKYNDISATDVVVDIGANLGGFTIPVSDMCKHVYAVEPLFVKELGNNINLNCVDNCTILPYGLGHGIIKLKYGDKTEHVKCISLTEIKNITGKIDFLKMDCEGGEWCIQPHELDGIRRIEMEVHGFNGENLTDFSNMLVNCGYKVNITNNKGHTMMVHATSFVYPPNIYNEQGQNNSKCNTYTDDAK